MHLDDSTTDSIVGSTARIPRATTRTRRKVLTLINLALHAAGAPTIDHLPKGQLSSKTNSPLVRALRPAGVTIIEYGAYGWWELPRETVAAIGVGVSTSAQTAKLRLAWRMNVGPFTIVASRHAGWTFLPLALHQFVVSFHRGRYPDLIEDEGAWSTVGGVRIKADDPSGTNV